MNRLNHVAVIADGNGRWAARRMKMPDRCVCCGAVIPEGRQVCPICERQWPDW